MSLHIFTRPDRDTTLLATATLFSDRSTCSRAHVGCVGARDGRILTTGYNGAPAGMPHCDHRCVCGPSDPGDEAHLDTCPAVNPCTIAAHAEVNAIAFAARHGVALEGSTLYVTMLPCLSCSLLIVNAGVVRVVFDQPYRDNSGLSLLLEAGIEVDRLA